MSISSSSCGKTTTQINSSPRSDEDDFFDSDTEDFDSQDQQLEAVTNIVANLELSPTQREDGLDKLQAKYLNPELSSDTIRQIMAVFQDVFYEDDCPKELLHKVCQYTFSLLALSPKFRNDRVSYFNLQNIVENQQCLFQDRVTAWKNIIETPVSDIAQRLSQNNNQVRLRQVTMLWEMFQSVVETKDISSNAENRNLLTSILKDSCLRIAVDAGEATLVTMGEMLRDIMCIKNCHEDIQHVPVEIFQEICSRVNCSDISSIATRKTLWTIAHDFLFHVFAVPLPKGCQQQIVRVLFEFEKQWLHEKLFLNRVETITADLRGCFFGSIVIKSGRDEYLAVLIGLLDVIVEECSDKIPASFQDKIVTVLKLIQPSTGPESPVTKLIKKIIPQLNKLDQ